MHRFFLPPDAIHGSQVQFSPDQARQLRSVLRLSAGDEVEALDGRGTAHRVELQHIGKSQAFGRILKTELAGGEPAGELVLCQSIIRGDRFESVLQKGVELGVTRFQPMLTRRTMRTTPGDSKWQRWQRIIQEAAEQCGRGCLPALAAPIPFAQALAERRGTTLFPAVSATRPLSAALAQAAWPVTLFIGPEGGFDPAEVELARLAGIEPVGLGPRILRTETAAFLLLSLVSAALGELDRPTPATQRQKCNLNRSAASNH